MKMGITEWLGVIKNDKRRVEEAREEVRRIREKLSKDIENRVHRTNRRQIRPNH